MKMMRTMRKTRNNLSILGQHMWQWLTNRKMEFYRWLYEKGWFKNFVSSTMAQQRLADIEIKFNNLQLSYSKLLAEYEREASIESDTTQQIIYNLKNRQSTEAQRKYILSSEGTVLFDRITKARENQAKLLLSIGTCKTEMTELQKENRTTDNYLAIIPENNVNGNMTEMQVIDASASLRAKIIRDTLIDSTDAVVKNAELKSEDDDVKTEAKMEDAQAVDLLSGILAKVNRDRGVVSEVDLISGEDGQERLQQLRENVLGENNNPLSGSSDSRITENTRLDMLLSFYGASGANKKNSRGRNQSSSSNINKNSNMNNSSKSSNSAGSSYNHANGLLSDEDSSANDYDDVDITLIGGHKSKKHVHANFAFL